MSEAGSKSTERSLAVERSLAIGYAAVQARRIAIHLAIFAMIITMWEIAGVRGLLNDLILPPPSKIVAALWEMYVVTKIIYWHFFVTMFEAASGFLIACMIGLSLAISGALNATFRRYIAPYAVVLNVTPGIAVTPIIIAWFGFGWSSKIALAALVAFFPIFVNTLSGLLRVDRDAEEMFRSLGATKRQTFFKLMLPEAAPIIMAGFKLALTAALIGTIVAEFVSATEGVGILLQRFSFRLDIASSIGVLITMSLMGLLLFTLVEVLDTTIIFWKRESRLQAVSRKRARRFPI